MSVPIPKKLRFEVLKRDRFTCRYCGRSAPEVALQVDHVVPRIKGGADRMDNLTTSCSDCNRAKGIDDLTPAPPVAVPVGASAIDSLTGAVEALRIERQLRQQQFAPVPRLTVSEWADRHRILSSESAAVPGRWTSFPYQREIMDACHGGQYRRVVAMLPSQIGKSEIFLNLLGYHLHLEPCPILVVEPDLEMARAISKDRIDPMFRDMPVLQGKLRYSARQESGNTILFKAGPGWRITLVGARSPAGLAMRPVRLCLFDEVDRYLASAGKEGDPIALGEKRSITFPNRLTYLCSSPGIKGESRIEPEYMASDQRKWVVPCPHCGHGQTLEWGGKDENFGLKWDTGKPDTAAYLCESCGVLIQEEHKGEMNKAAGWVATYPGREVAGFQMTALPSPVIRWRDLVKQWLTANEAKKQGNLALLQTFVNTSLARTWEEPGDRLDIGELRERRETYAAEVPMGVGLLLMSVDVQPDRLEALIVGWGAGEESWLIRHHRIPGNPERKGDESWQTLEAIRTRAYQHESGQGIRIRGTVVDFGHAMGAVSEWVRPRIRQGVFAVKGASTYHHPVIGSKPSKSDKYRIPLWMVGGDATKGLLFSRLRLVVIPGPGYVHIPNNVTDDDEKRAWIDDLFLSQYANERAVYVTHRARRIRTYKPVNEHAAVEAIDCSCYNIALLWILGPAVKENLGKLAKSLQDKAAGAEMVIGSEEFETFASSPEPVKQNPWTKGKSGFMKNWKRR